MAFDLSKIFQFLSFHKLKEPTSLSQQFLLDAVFLEPIGFFGDICFQMLVSFIYQPFSEQTSHKHWLTLGRCLSSAFPLLSVCLDTFRGSSCYLVQISPLTASTEFLCFSPHLSQPGHQHTETDQPPPASFLLSNSHVIIFIVYWWHLLGSFHVHLQAMLLASFIHNLSKTA